MFSRCKIRVQESARMQDFAPFTPDPQPHSNWMLWRATMLRNLGALLATYWLYIISIPVIRFQSEVNGRWWNSEHIVSKPLHQVKPAFSVKTDYIQWNQSKPKNKAEYCINQTLNEVQMQELFVNLTCINWTHV